MQTNLLKPKTINVEQISANRAKVELEPFERGYGHTLGNAIRRVLLSSMDGYAPTEVSIAGVVHEYASIDGVQEDVINILLNLKGVVFKLYNRDEVTLSLRKDVEGVVVAGDIQTPHDVEIINPEHPIATLSAGGKLDMQIKVEKGRGYVPGNQRWHGDEPNKAIGRIVMDASFSPIRRVSYTVERSRGAAHGLGQTGARHRNQWHGHGGGSRPHLGEDPGRTAGGIRPARWRGYFRSRGLQHAFQRRVLRSGAAAPGRRAGAHGAFGQLPQGREHLLYR